MLIVDDHPVVRSGLKLILEAEPDLQVVGEAGTIEQALPPTRSSKPNVILLDLHLPGKSGIEGAPELLEQTPEAKLLVLSVEADPRYIRAALGAGAAGYLLKESTEAELVTAVRAVARGGRYISSLIAERLVAAETEERARIELDPLSEREREVLRLLALGYTNSEVARMLDISVRTAETHRAHIMQKLTLATRAELVRYAIDTGVLADEASGSS